MKQNLKKLKSMKKMEKSCIKKLSDVKNVENIKQREIKHNFMDLVTEDIWDYMNEFNDEDLKCSLE